MPKTCCNFDFLTLPELIARREMFARRNGADGNGAGDAAGEDRSLAGELAAHRARTGPHHAPRPAAVIQLFQHGGPSHMDLLDPKPELNKRDGQPMPKYFTDLVAIPGTAA